MAMEMTQSRSAGDVARAEPIRQGPRFIPAADICEDAEQYTVWLDMPGVDPQDVDVRFEQGLLSVWGKVAPRRAEKAAMLLSEYQTGDYFRTFNITDSIDAGRVSAEVEDGVLRLTLPKAEAAKPKKIQVRGK
jgi:HSP20 family protein